MAYSQHVREETIDMFTVAALQEQIEVVVGDGGNEVTFPVPKTLLCYASDFFVKALANGTWGEGQDKKVTLEQFQPEIFAVFLAWAYSPDRNNARTAPGLTQSPPSDIETQDNKQQWFLAQWSKLVKCWALGEYLQAPHFQNTISNLLVSNYLTSKSESRALVAATVPAVGEVWRTTRPGSAVRRITLDGLILDLDLPRGELGSMYQGDDALTEFVADLCQLSLGYVKSGGDIEPVSLHNLCRYHTHVPPLLPGLFCNNQMQ